MTFTAQTISLQLNMTDHLDSAHVRTDLRACKNAWADGDNIIHGGKYKKARSEYLGPYNDTAGSMTEREKNERHATGWSNQFALPWEVSSYWAFTTR